MRRLIWALLMALSLAVFPAAEVFAATTATITISATPIFISIMNMPNSKDLGSLDEGAVTWSQGAAPAGPDIAESDCYFTLINSSSVAIDVSIRATDMTTGVPWTLSDTGTPGVNTYALYAGVAGTPVGSMVVVKKNTPYNLLVSNMQGSSSKKWEFKHIAPTDFGDPLPKTGVITLTAAAH